MRSPRYKQYLRTLYGAVLNSRLSPADLRILSDELRRGQLADELAYMIAQDLEHLGNSDEDEPEDERVAEAERLIRNGRVSKGALASIITSLGGTPSSGKESIHGMLDRFIRKAPASRVSKLMDVLASSQLGDSFLTGIETRK